jgi:hypothetical protein
VNVILYKLNILEACKLAVCSRTPTVYFYTVNSDTLFGLMTLVGFHVLEC